MRRRRKISSPCEKVVRFSTVAELSDDFKNHEFGKNDGRGNWYGGSVDSVFDLLKNGDLANVERAERIVSKINDSLTVAGVRQEWAPDMVGAFPSVPAYLAGDPCSMWARQPVMDERGEISVFVDTCVSENCKPDEMRRRGIVVLAVLMALQRVRNVRAAVFCSVETCCPVVDLSYPFDVSEVSAMVTCPQITRRALYGAAHMRGFRGKWADWSSTVTNDETERAAVIRLLGADPDSLVLTPHKLGSMASISESELIERINGMIENLSNGNPAEL